MNEEAASKFLSLSSDQRLQIIGRKILLDNLGASPHSKDSEIEAGRSWFEGVRGEVQKVVCSSKVALDTTSALASEGDVKLCLIIGDLVLNIVHGIPVLCVSAEIVKIGMHRFCNEIWKSHGLA